MIIFSFKGVFLVVHSFDFLIEDVIPAKIYWPENISNAYFHIFTSTGGICGFVFISKSHSNEKSWLVIYIRPFLYIIKHY